MTAPAATFNLSATVSAASGPIAIGDVVVPIGGVYYRATTANLVTAAQRAHGIATSAWSASTVGSVSIQHVGIIDASVSGLATGAASWVRVSTAGRLERVTPAGADDVCGYASADGTVFVLFGLLTAAIVNGGGAFTPPTGTGLVSVTAGVLDPASIKVNLASGTYVTGTLAVGNGGTGITSLGAGVATFLGTPSGANLGTALTSALAANKVVQATGTGIPHVVAGALSAASSLIVDADVATGAAIAASKLAAAASDTFCQFNDAGVFNGTADFTFTKGSGTVTGFNIVASNSLNVASSKLVADGSNIGLGGAISAGGGTLVVFIANASVVPTTNPVGGGVLYVQAGALKYRGSAGTITVLGPA